MPRTRLDKLGKKHEKLNILLTGYLYQDERNLTAASNRLGVATSTLYRRMKDPGTLTIDELLHICRVYKIPIDDLRTAIRY